MATTPGRTADSSGPRALCVIVDPVATLGCPDSRQQSSTRSEASSAPQLGDVAPVRETSANPRYDPRRLAVRVERGATQRGIAATFARAGVTLERSIPTLHAFLVGVDPQRRAEALASLRSSPVVASAGREAISTALDTTPNDTDWPFQDGLRVAGFPKAWDITRGSQRIVVAVVDTGVDPTQPDLRGALVSGYDFVNSDSNPTDDHGHGTAVAGIIAARSDNSRGLAGICWFCSVMPVKVLDATGSGDDTVIAAGIVWAVDHGAQVINLSLGGPGSSSSLTSAIAYAVRNGVAVVAAAGNSGSTVPFYPAADPNALSVAGTTTSDRPYSWSNYGSWVNLAAPGCNVAPMLRGGYGNFCGTSSAAPLVAGLVALELSAEPNATPSDARQALYAAAAPLPGVVQHGRINAFATLSRLGGALRSTRVRAVLRGTLGPNVQARTYPFVVGAGTLTATLVAPHARALSLTVTDPGGRVVTRITGQSPLHLDQAVEAGPLNVTVQGDRTRSSFTLTVSYVQGPTA